MLQDRIRYHQQVAHLSQLLAAMPEYPIYREVHGGYSIYIDDQCYWFGSLEVAQLGQLIARAHWLRAHQAASKCRAASRSV
jgi:hypothetical protein